MEANHIPDFRLIGRRVREFRTMRGMTQEKLAEAANLSVPFVSHIERGVKKSSITTLVKLAAALDVTVDAFLTGWQPNEMPAINSDFKNLLDDCAPRERMVILQIASATKQILRNTSEI